eukprot:923932-Amphidinium_carterae.1
MEVPELSRATSLPRALSSTIVEVGIRKPGEEMLTVRKPQANETHPDFQIVTKGLGVVESWTWYALSNMQNLYIRGKERRKNGENLLDSCRGWKEICH